MGKLINQTKGGTLINQQQSLGLPPPSSNLHSTGPVHVWVAFPTAQQGGGSVNFVGPLYVGTCEMCPVTEGSILNKPVFASTGGSEAPYDKEFAGKAETIICDLNRFDANVVNWLERAPVYARQVNSLQQKVPQSTYVGDISSGRLDRGSLLIANTGYFQLWLQYTFYGTANATPDLPPGWFYYCCSSAAVYIPKQGTRTKMRRLVVEAMEIHDEVSDYNWYLKTNNPSAFVPLVGAVLT